MHGGNGATGAGGTAAEGRDVVIRLAGDSGDGMQLTGNRLTAVSALAGNDLSTFPDFPAEIRAPAGTLPGVSAFQVRIASHEVTTPGDAATVLVAMNPAALRAELPKVVRGATLIVNTDAFGERDLKKAGYADDPLQTDALDGFDVIRVPMTSLTRDAVAPLGVKPRDAERSKNFFALGLLCWMYERDAEAVRGWIAERFAGKDQVVAANQAAFDAGLHFGETTEVLPATVAIPPAPRRPGTYRSITGNQALAWGLMSAGRLADLPVFLGSYPITPASDVLHELARHPEMGVQTFQAEDEIAAISAAIGAAFGGALGVTTTSGPGLSLKAEALGLAVSLELPLLVVDIQRGGPSTGLPTKTEQADLLQAMFGRHGECPLPVVAAYEASHCFHAAIEAARIALRYRTPVVLLSDGYLANSSEPWRLPDLAELPDISVPFATEANHERADGEAEFWPYLRDPETLARPWAVPGTPGLEHRIGGIEKHDGSGEISYDPANHQRMVELRAAKVEGIAADIAPVEVVGDPDADVLVVGWGSTWGAITHAVSLARAAGRKVAHAHLVHLNPFPPNLGEVLRRHPRVLVPEMNLGQLALLLRARYLVDARPVNKVAGVPFTTAELLAEIEKAAELEETRP